MHKLFLSLPIAVSMVFVTGCGNIPQQTTVAPSEMAPTQQAVSPALLYTKDIKTKEDFLAFYQEIRESYHDSTSDQFLALIQFYDPKGNKADEIKTEWHAPYHAFEEDTWVPNIASSTPFGFRIDGDRGAYYWLTPREEVGTYGLSKFRFFRLDNAWKLLIEEDSMQIIDLPSDPKKRATLVQEIIDEDFLRTSGWETVHYKNGNHIANLSINGQSIHLGDSKPIIIPISAATSSVFVIQTNLKKVDGNIRLSGNGVSDGPTFYGNWSESGNASTTVNIGNSPKWSGQIVKGEIKLYGPNPEHPQGWPDYKDIVQDGTFYLKFE